MLSGSLLRPMVLSVLVLVACRGGDDAPERSSASSSPTRSGPEIQGGWTVAEYISAEGTSASNPPGMFLFANTAYSIMYSNQRTARATFADADAPTDPEKLRAFDTFIANSGRYDLVGDTLVIHPVISKNPNYMGGDKTSLQFAQPATRSGLPAWLVHSRGPEKRFPPTRQQPLSVSNWSEPGNSTDD